MGWFDWFQKLRQPRSMPPAAEPPPATPPPTQEHERVPALSLSAGSYELRVGVVSDVGTCREHNEDNYYVPGRPSLQSRRREPNNGHRGAGNAAANTATIQGPPGLFLVADGMGGQLAGEKASEMAVEIVPAELARRLSAGDDEKATRRAIREAVAEANKEIMAQSHLVNEFANMGTTVVLALFRGSRVYIAGVGDSRAYRLRDGRIERLTKDHSLADALGEAGTIRPEEVENHKFRHVLYLYLGCKDARDGPDEIRSLDVRLGDRFLLASDGLTGVVRDPTIAEVVLACDDPQRAAQALVNRAIENRSKDNITCVVIEVSGPSSDAAAETVSVVSTAPPMPSP